MIKHKKLLAIIIMPILVGIGFFGATKNVSAAYSKSDIYKHVLINNYNDCYRNGLVSSIMAKDYYYRTTNENGAPVVDFTNILNSDYSRPKDLTHSFRVPTMIGNALEERDGEQGTIANCHALLFGDLEVGNASAMTLRGHATGLINSPPSDWKSSSFQSFMSLLGYEANNTSDAGTMVCVESYIKDMSRTDPVEEPNGRMCFNKQDLVNGIVNYDNYSGYLVEDDGKITIYSRNRFKSSCGVNGSSVVYSGPITTNNSTFDYQKIKDINGYSGSARDIATGKEYSHRFVVNEEPYNSVDEDGNVLTASTVFVHKMGLFSQSVNGLSGGAYSATTRFSDAEKYQLYLYYLGDIYEFENIGGTGCQRSKPRRYDADGKNWVWLNREEEEKWCSINVNEAKKNEKVTVFAGSNIYLNGVVDYNGLLQEMFSLDYSDMSEIGEFNGVIEDMGNGEEVIVNNVETNCANSGGAESLGWIVCPLLNWLGNAASDAYEKYVEPSLQIEPRLFSGNDGGVYQGWETFRNIANILFIILLLVVIFSQLTGVGIDNYGIKKILPKLIVAVILINLSYLICLLLVDISNILGNSLRALFVSLSPELPSGGLLDILDEPAEIVRRIESTALTSVAILGVLVTMVGAVWHNPAIILSLLVGALGVVISVFFLFILLSVREAAIIVLVAISPVAIVCYILPNTKKLFDKWLKFLQGLLLVYPICGLLVGGGDYVSHLLLSSGFGNGSFLNAFTAMIVGIVPVFFIPMALKSAFVAMGGIGAKLAGLGSLARRGATKRIRDTEGYRNAQKMGLERRIRKKAGVDKEGQLTERGQRKANRAKLFGSAATRRQAARVQQARKTIGEAETANAVLTGALATAGIAATEKGALTVEGVEQDTVNEQLGDTLTSEQKYYYSDFLRNARSGSYTGLNSSIQAMRASNMKDKDIMKIIRFAVNNGQINMDPDLRSQWMREAVKTHGDVFATDFEASHFFRSGGDNNGGVLGNYGDYAANAPIDIDEIKPEDLIRLSGDSLAGLASAGKITKEMAQSVMAMNPNISAEKKIMLGAIAKGAATGNEYEYDANGRVARDDDGNVIVMNRGTINGNTGQFKADATRLMNNPSFTTTTMDHREFTADSVRAWVAPTPQSVNVVQNFQGGGQQFSPVDARIGGQQSEIDRLNAELRRAQNRLQDHEMHDNWRDTQNW